MPPPEATCGFRAQEQSSRSEAGGHLSSHDATAASGHSRTQSAVQGAQQTSSRPPWEPGQRPAAFRHPESTSQILPCFSAHTGPALATFRQWHSTHLYHAGPILPFQPFTNWFAEFHTVIKYASTIPKQFDEFYFLVFFFHCYWFATKGFFDLRKKSTIWLNQSMNQALVLLSQKLGESGLNSNTCVSESHALNKSQSILMSWHPHL